MKEAGVTKAICVNQEVGNVALDPRREVAQRFDKFFQRLPVGAAFGVEVAQRRIVRDAGVEPVDQRHERVMPADLVEETLRLRHARVGIIGHFDYPGLRGWKLRKHI